ncbi:MAG TPA: DUF2231 domain-containing protein [Nocardioidaceae bacterium]|nr:DUF2231 domain-containing protein [Nocardioidaceae bacterium]
MEIAGLPLHPLVVHTTVTLVPLSALVSVVFAVVPRWRWLLRWPAGVLAVLAAVVAWVSRLSGSALLEDRPFLLDSPQLRDQIERHQQLGELLSLVSLPYAALVLLASWSLAGTTALASGRGARESRLPALEKVLLVLVVLFSLGVLVLVVLTGDSGARAVWG